MNIRGNARSMGKWWALEMAQMVTLLDYGAGNVRSVRNAIRALGFTVKDVAAPADILSAEKLIFPGVGSFGSTVRRLHESGYFEPLIDYLHSGRPFLGICLGLQTLFEGSEESPGVPGLGIIKGHVSKIDERLVAVPHIGWNGVRICKPSPLFSEYRQERLYFVHSYRAVASEENSDWILCTTDYGGRFISGVQRGDVAAFQFHPEKSGAAGLAILKNFLGRSRLTATDKIDRRPEAQGKTMLAKRIIACLDVRTNDQGDLVVTKGDRYDVRERGQVRNLGKPVALAKRYYEDGADEITFLNITGFRDFPLRDQPMLEVLRRTSENVFVPLTIGGGIRAYTDSQGKFHSALAVAAEYFRSGADKVSIGSDAVYAVEAHLRAGRAQNSAISEIAEVYGSQAVVISIDPRRVYVSQPDQGAHRTIRTEIPGPNGERYCWYQCTVKGGREGRDLDAWQLARVCEQLGAGEILLNCIDRDGTKLGFDIELIHLISEAVSIPVIASSGAGKVEHFAEVFEKTTAQAALAAGIFHRREVAIADVKKHLRSRGIEMRE